MLQKNRSSCLEVFCRKGILRYFKKFTGKHLCQSLLFNEVAGLRTVTLLKKRFWYKCFTVNFSKFLKTTSTTEHLWWLLLKTHVNQLIFRKEFVDLQLYYSRTFSQEVFKYMSFKQHKTTRWNFGLTPRFYFLEGELTHWVDKAKMAWLIVGQLLIKAGWWYAPLALPDFSWSNKQNHFSF